MKDYGVSNVDFNAYLGDKRRRAAWTARTLLQLVLFSGNILCRMIATLQDKYYESFMKSKRIHREKKSRINL